MLDELKDSMAEKMIELTYDDTVIKWLTDKAYSITYGARNLRRLIQTDIEDKIAQEIITNYAHPVKKVGVTAAEGKVQVLAV